MTVQKMTERKISVVVLRNTNLGDFVETMLPSGGKILGVGADRLNHLLHLYVEHANGVPTKDTRYFMVLGPDCVFDVGINVKCVGFVEVAGCGPRFVYEDPKI